MASMTELFYGDKEPTWAFSTYYDYTDHNNYQEVDPHYTQAAITRYMSPAMEIRCCSKCEHKLRAALRNIQGVDSILSGHDNKKLMVTGSADADTVHYALKHVLKNHHHFWPQKIHNPFRGLLSRHSHSRYAPSWNQTGNHNSYGNNAYNAPYVNASDDTWKYGGKYGPSYGHAPQHHYRPGSLRHLLFDSHRSSNHSNSGYSYY